MDGESQSPQPSIGANAIGAARSRASPSPGIMELSSNRRRILKSKFKKCLTFVALVTMPLWLPFATLYVMFADGIGESFDKLNEELWGD